MSHVDLPRGRLPSQQIGDYSITAISDGRYWAGILHVRLARRE